MNALTQLKLSESGRLEFLDDEVEMKSMNDGIHLYSQIGVEKSSEIFQDAVYMVTLTNMRLVFFVNLKSGKCTTAWAISLSLVEFVEDCAKRLLSRSTRIRICVCRNVLTCMRYERTV